MQHRPRVALTHPDRVLYPRDGITKEELAGYFEAVQGPLLAALRDRPLNLEHWSKGIDGPSWFHQDLGREVRSWMAVAAITARGHGKAIHHLVADGPDALRWLAQHATLAIHAWHARRQHPEMPDWVVFDLDPAEGQGFASTIPVARALRTLFEKLSVPSVPKTSGKRGLHLLVPLAPGHTFDDATRFAERIAAAVTAVMPGVTTERALAKRRGRLYLDTVQNAFGKTIVAPYSPRAVDGAPVSAPLRWDEVDEQLDPARFNLRTMRRRLDEVGDLFAPALTAGVRLPRWK